MVKHRKHGCALSAKVVGSRAVVKGSCPGKGGKIKVVHAKKATKHHKHRVDVPASCKGMKKGVKRNACVRKACDQRPVEYRAQCKKAAGLKKV